MLQWEKEHGQIERDDCPRQMLKVEEDRERQVPFVYDPSGASYVTQYLRNCGREGCVTRAAGGYQSLVRGRATQAANGHQS